MRKATSIFVSLVACISLPASAQPAAGKSVKSLLERVEVPIWKGPYVAEDTTGKQISARYLVVPERCKLTIVLLTPSHRLGGNRIPASQVPIDIDLRSVESFKAVGEYVQNKYFEFFAGGTTGAIELQQAMERARKHCLGKDEKTGTLSDDMQIRLPKSLPSLSIEPSQAGKVVKEILESVDMPLVEWGSDTGYIGKYIVQYNDCMIGIEEFWPVHIVDGYTHDDKIETRAINLKTAKFDVDGNYVVSPDILNSKPVRLFAGGAATAEQLRSALNAAKEHCSATMSKTSKSTASGKPA